MNDENLAFSANQISEPAFKPGEFCDLDEKSLLQTRNFSQNSDSFVVMSDSRIPSYNFYEEKIQQLSHDIKGPIRNIVSFLQLIKLGLESSLKEPLDDYIDFALSSARSLNEFSLSLLKNGEVQEMPVKLKDIIDEIIVMNKFQIMQRDVQIVLDENIPLIKARYIDLVSLFKNLIENALKHSKTITMINIKLIKQDYSCVELRFVSDAFLSDEDKSAIDAMMAYPFKGLGICKKSVENLGGELKLERSEHNLSYTIKLPLWREKTI